MPMNKDEGLMMLSLKNDITNLRDRIKVLENKVNAQEKTILRMHEAGTSLWTKKKIL